MHGVEEALKEAVNVSLNSASTDVKDVFFRSTKMGSTFIAHQWLMDKRIHSRFECWTHSKMLVNELAEEMCKPPSIKERVVKITTCNVIKENFIKNETIVEPDAQNRVIFDDGQRWMLSKARTHLSSAGKNNGCKSSQLYDGENEEMIPLNINC